MQVVPVEEEPVTGVVVGVVTEQPGPSSGVVDQTLAMLDGLADEGGRGSLESLGRWNEKRSDRAMPIKLKAERDAETMVRVAFGKLVDELVQTNASSGILAISNWKEMRGPHEVTLSEMSWSEVSWSEVSWSASGTSYQRHGSVDEVGRLKAQLAAAEAKKSIAFTFADFKGVVDDFGGEDQIAVYRVTLPRGRLDPNKWVGRPPPPAPADLYTGPRSDGLLSTDEISGEYSAPGCVEGKICNSMTVVPLGPDAIETWRTVCVIFPPFIGPTAEGALRTRKPGTNTFDGMTFSADGTAKQGCGNFKKRPDSQKRAFQKVETRDLAGKWGGCCCNPFVPCWPLSQVFCTTKKALNEDQYAEKGLCCCLCLPCCISETRTRKYVNGHPTNGFALDGAADPYDVLWYRDPGCAAGPLFFAKKLC